MHLADFLLQFGLSCYLLFIYFPLPPPSDTYLVLYLGELTKDYLRSNLVNLGCIPSLSPPWDQQLAYIIISCCCCCCYTIQDIINTCFGTSGQRKTQLIICEWAILLSLIGQYLYFISVEHYVVRVWLCYKYWKKVTAHTEHMFYYSVDKFKTT